jgi:hypothetical protein
MRPVSVSRFNRCELPVRSEGNPRKIADVIVQLANSDEVPVRLILGIDAEKRVQRAEAARASEAEKLLLTPSPPGQRQAPLSGNPAKRIS